MCHGDSRQSPITLIFTHYLAPFAMQTSNGMASLECGKFCFINKDLNVGLHVFGMRQNTGAISS